MLIWKHNSFLVNLVIKKSGLVTGGLEHQIDVMVYHLYGLSYDEACVIDAALKEEDYVRFKFIEKWTKINYL